MVWYSHLFKSFPQFIMIHTVKGFGIVNEIEVDVFLEFPSFVYDPANIEPMHPRTCALGRARCSKKIYSNERLLPCR